MLTATLVKLRLRLQLLLLFALVGITSCAGPGPHEKSAARRVPVILDTDIGDDIDDTWALGLLLKSPELDLKLALGEYGRAQYRAKLLAKFLQTVGRADVPVGIGLHPESGGAGAQAEWVKDYDLRGYPGRVYQDGVQALIDTIMKSPEPVTVICIGPLPNIAAALEREPRIAQRAKFVGMQGSIRVGYDGSDTVSAEWNVKANPQACQHVFASPWKEMTITPLDTCGLVRLDGNRYERVRDSQDPVAATIIENYRIWSHHQAEAEAHSTTLFDTVAVYLAIRQDFCEMERLGLRVTDDGYTRIDPAGKPISVATRWTNLDAYRDFLVQRLTQNSSP